jgi:hypothetical protein
MSAPSGAAGGGSFATWFDAQRGAKPDGAAAPRSAPAAGGGLLGGLFGGGSGAAGGRDVESRGGGGGDDDATTETSSFLPGFVRTALGTAPPPPPEWTCGLTIAQRWQIAILLLVASGLLFMMALFVFLPMVLIMPSKFASAITFGSLFFMTALACIRGPRTSLMGFLDPARWLFTTAYLASLALTLYATMASHSYFLIVAATVVQIGALLWYAATFIPGGTAGMGIVSRLFLSSAASTARGIGGMVVGR